MSDVIVDAVAEKVLKSPLIADEIDVCFHMGEPLSAGIDWFKRALSRFEKSVPTNKSVSYKLQTNGTLVTPQWVELFTEHTIKLSFSLDGPKEINDCIRTRRSGKGTHADVIRGIKLIQEHDIPFSILCVLTENSLQYPDEIFNHFLHLRPELVCFNIEEIEGVNKISSIASDEKIELCKSFFIRFWELLEKAGFPFEVREFEQSEGLILHRLKGRDVHNSLVKPLSYLSISALGNVGTFAPEMIILSDEALGDFFIGNILDKSLEEMARSKKLALLEAEVSSGVKNCERTCQYFEFCLGGSPSNKLAELGSLSGTETWWCRTSIQLILDIVIQRLQSNR